MREKNKNKIMIMEGFSKRLAFSMKEKSLSQNKLSKIIRITQPEISYYLSSHSYPRLDILQKLAFFLDVNYEWLKSGVGSYLVSEPYPIEHFHISFSERLIWLIWSRELTIKELASKLGYTSTTSINQYIIGNRFPNRKRFIEICDFFDVSPEWLAPKESDLILTLTSINLLDFDKADYMSFIKQYSIESN